MHSDAVEFQLFAEPGDILSITRQTIKSFRDDDVNPSFSNIIEHSPKLRTIASIA